jgi:hypothetical protein
MLKRLVIFFVTLLAGGCFGNNIITLPYITNDIQYSKVHDKLYAIVDAMDPDYGNQLIEINVITGAVERSQFVGSVPGLMRLTSDENYAWISFRGTPYIKRVDLNSFLVDKKVYLGPSKLYNSPNHVQTSVYAYNFTVMPDQDNQVVMGLKTPFEFEFEAVSLYKNDTIQPKRMGQYATMNPPFCLEPVSNGAYIIGHYQSSANSFYSTLRVVDDGLVYLREQETPIEGMRRNWFKVHNDTLFTAVGDIFDATDTSTLKMLGNCKNDIIGDKYGFAYSEFNQSFVYPNSNKPALYLTFYNKNNFGAFDSVYLFDYNYYELMLILDLEVIRDNRFALLIGKDWGQFTICIVEVNPAGIGTIKPENAVEMFPNPVAGKMVIRGFPLHKRIGVYDLAGKLIGSFEMDGVEGEIDLGGYRRGTYLVKVTDREGREHGVVRKIVVP